MLHLLAGIWLQVEEENPVVAGVALPRGVVVPYQHGHKISN